MAQRSHFHSLPAAILFVLCIAAILLSIATRIECLFNSDSREPGDSRHDLNVFDDECKLQKSGLNDELDFNFDFDVLTSTAVDTIGATVNTLAPLFNYTATGVASHKINDLGYEFNAVLVLAAVTIVTNEKN